MTKQTTPKRVVLTSSTNPSELRAMIDAGQTDVDTVFDWATTSPIDAGVGALMSELAAIMPDKLGEIAEAQTAFAVSKAKQTSRSAGAIRWAVSRKGAISIYGLNSRFPITLYAGQLARLAEAVFGLDGAAYSESPVGKWVASNPTEAHAIESYDKSKTDQQWFARFQAGDVPFAKRDGGSLIVGLAKEKLA